ncbi:MAG: polyphosphate kinase [Halioglobus sp.]|jgi:polyphosphate kinase
MLEPNNKKYFNRDLSWLKFNHRVLQEAADSKNLLYDRIKFLAIFSSNLDEFFKVRVASIRRIKNLKKNLRKKLITKPNKLLTEILQEVQNQQEEFGEIFRNQIIPELENKKIKIIGYNQFSTNQKNFAQRYFDNKLKDIIEIKSSKESGVNEMHIENEELYLTSLKQSELLLVKIPQDSPRFIIGPDSSKFYNILYLDDILKYNLYNKYQSEFYSIKGSRDAELYIDDEYTGDLLSKIKNSLSNRESGQLTRMLIDGKIPESYLPILQQAIGSSEADLVMGGTYHNYKDFFGFPNPTNKSFSSPSISPKVQTGLDQNDSIFNAINKRDRLLYFPYESFSSVVNFVNQASKAKDVSKIKITLYRVSQDSAIAEALVAALKNGKKVTVFIETKARFDEANNIRWGQILEDHGATVIYSYPAIKVHSKILYIETVNGDEKKSFGYIGTGNFNEKTSKIYTDFGLFTSNKKLTTELRQIFKVLEGELIIPKTKNLLVSPFSARSSFEALIENEITNAKKGKKSYIILKLNSLEDKKMIDLLYKASNAGVKQKLIVRGICCLVPGIKKQSENISVISIVDKYLEHARVYVFANGGKEKIYIGSADWMTRNLDHRIEVIAPILDKRMKSKVKKIIDLQLSDNLKARIIDVAQSNKYFKRNDKEISSQEKSEQIVATF